MKSNDYIDRIMDYADQMKDDDELIVALKDILEKDPSPNTRMFSDAFTSVLTLIARLSLVVEDELNAANKIGSNTLAELEAKYGSDLSKKIEYTREEDIMCERTVAVIHSLQWMAQHMKNLVTQASEVFTLVAKREVPELGKMIRDKQAEFDKKFDEEQDFEEMLRNFSQKKSTGDVLPS